MLIPKAPQFFLTFVAAAVLAGCSGSGGSSSLQPGGVSSDSQSHSALAQSLAENVIDDAKCTSSGGLTVAPCPVKLTPTTESVDLLVTGGPKGGTITEIDNCTANTIAVVKGSGENWVATAGNNKGACVATFTETKGKKTVGTATLPIKNKV